jgi:hypothetical protein
MFDANQILFETAWEALPKYRPDRQKEILQALKVKISHKHPAWGNVNAQLAILEGLEKLQSELPFTPSPKKASHHEGHHNGHGTGGAK